jgi:hypothetical protein
MAAVRGANPASAASGVSQTMRQASRDRVRTASVIAAWSPRSRPSDTISTSAPAGKAGKARNAEEGLQRIADAGAAVPVGHGRRGRGERLVAVGEAHGAGDRVRRVPTVNTSMRSLTRARAWAKRRLPSVWAFIEPETSISSRMRRCLSLRAAWAGSALRRRA